MNTVSVDKFIKTLHVFGLYFHNNQYKKITNLPNFVKTTIFLILNAGFFLFTTVQTPEYTGLREWVFTIEHMFYAAMCFISHLIYLLNFKKLYNIIVLTNYHYKINKSKLKTIILVEILFGFAILTFMYVLTLFGTYLHFISNYKYMYKDAYSHLMHYIFSFIMYLIETTMINIFLLIKQCFVKINNNIQDLINHKALNFISIEQIACSHFNLCILTEKLNNIFALQFIISFLANFIEITYSAYFIIITIINFDFDSDGIKLFSLYLIPWFIFHLVKLIVLSMVSQSLESEVRTTNIFCEVI